VQTHAQDRIPLKPDPQRTQTRAVEKNASQKSEQTVKPHGESEKKNVFTVRSEAKIRICTLNSACQ
jgi:hypothetical protein